MLAPIVGTILLVILAIVLIRMTHAELDELARLTDQEYETGHTLSEISNALSSNHAQIYDLLATVDDTTEEGEFYDASKPLLFHIHSIRDAIENELWPVLSEPDEIEAIRNFLEHLERYRVNATNAMLMATVDTALAKRVMSGATVEFNGLNATLLNVNSLINDRLDNELAA